MTVVRENGQQHVMSICVSVRPSTVRTLHYQDQLLLERQRQTSFIPFADKRVYVQVKL